MTLEKNNVLDLIDNFQKEYLKESSKLPFHFNLLDELHANENAHSRILLKILSYHNNGKYPFLESFFTDLKIGFEKLQVTEPSFSTEKHRIDLLIKDQKGEYAIIIENKIHGAVDQPEQINRYISKLVTLGFKNDKIFILYLTRSGGSPSEESITKKEIETLEGRYKEINFRDHILPWLEGYDLSKLCEKDTLFVSSVQQYIDHLNGMFHKRAIEKEMNNKLENWISKELEAESNSEFEKIEKKVTVIKEKREQISNLDGFLLNMLENKIQLIFEHWKNAISEKFKDCKVESNVVDNPEKRFFYLGIKLRYKEVDFLCAIGLDDYTENPYFGITARGCSGDEGESKNEGLRDHVNEKLKGLGFRDSPRWYAWKYAEFSSIREEWFKLIDTLKESAGITMPDSLYIVTNVKQVSNESGVNM